MNKEKEQWEIEFDENFEELFEIKDWDMEVIVDKKRSVKNFIKKTRQEAIDWGAERERERLMSKIPPEWNDGHDEEELSLLEEVSGKPYETPEFLKERMYGYNLCRKRLLGSLTPQDNKKE